MDRIASRFHPFGTTIFTEISRLANDYRAINLGQGFPDFHGPPSLFDAARCAMGEGHNQYAPMTGVPLLRQRIAERWARDTHQSVDPDRCITVTAGCTEALAAAALGLLNPGDEIVVFEPFYDSYRAVIAMAGAVARYVPLRAPSFRFDPDELRRAFSARTRAVLINTPHNPTGVVFTRDELRQIADLCIEHDAVAIADEVYEHLTYAVEHVRIATTPGMEERTLTLSSLGKTFSLTGWKIGWAIGAPELTTAVRAAHQFLTFAVATPLQYAAAEALAMPDAYFTDLRAQFTQRRDFLCDVLTSRGFSLRKPDGGYFVMADHTPFGFDDDASFVRHLIMNVGVAAIPPSSFYATDARADAKRYTRFAFCKQMATLEAAAERLQRLTPAGA